MQQFPDLRRNVQEVRGLDFSCAFVQNPSFFEDRMLEGIFQGGWLYNGSAIAIPFAPDAIDQVVQLHQGQTVKKILRRDRFFGCTARKSDCLLDVLKGCTNHGRFF